MNKMWVLGFFFLTACSPAGCSTQNTSTPSPEPTVIVSTPRPTPLPSVSVTPALKIQQILTTGSLNLKVNEELMLIGDVKMSNGQQVSFDSVKSLLMLENLNPDLISLNPDTRLIRALKSGTATLVIGAKGSLGVQATVNIQIAGNTSEIDPNTALVDVEIE